MHGIVAFYAVQFHLLRRWSGGSVAVVRRGIETLAVAATALVLTAWLLPGLSIRDVGAAVLLGITLVIVTTAARPLLIGLLSGFSVALVAVATILLQGLVFWLLTGAAAGIAVTSVAQAVLASFTYALTSAVLTASLSLGDDRAFFGTLVRQLAVRHRDAVRTNRPGLVLIQVDGLARAVLEDQMRAGRVPNLARWMRTGAMTLDPWETLLPSQTSASQAGILHGNGDQIPGFRWWDKTTERLLISNHPADAHEIMRRVSNGKGLLAGGGASIGNLLSGDATRSYLTAATIDDPAREARRSHVLDWFFVSPYAFVRWIVLAVGEVLKELIQAREEASAGVQPRGDRGFPYPLARATSNVLLRHLSTALVIEEMYRGAPVIYVDFVDYDEIAHHSGPLRVEAYAAIDGIDRIIAVIEKAGLDAPRPYRFVVLSDHGQSPGATFQQRYGRSLVEVIGELAGANAVVGGAAGHGERWGGMNALLSEASGIRRLTRALSKGLLGRRAVVGAAGKQPPNILIAATGNLANVSFPRLPGRVSLEMIDRTYPRLIAGLVSHPGVGLVMVRSESRGVVVRSAGGLSHLTEGGIEGVDPVAGFGGHAADGLKGLDAMPACGDLVIISQYDSASGEVAAFEAQVGSHGGLGGMQTHPFILHPAEWSVDSTLVGAPALYAQIRRWLASPA